MDIIRKEYENNSLLFIVMSFNTKTGRPNRRPEKKSSYIKK